MKSVLVAAALAVLAGPALADNVAVSIRLGEPGFFGQIELGNAPQPRLVYAQPVVVAPVPEYREAPPIYLRVPPGHEKHWKKHCREYNACGRPVLFVRDDWYQNEYVPHYRNEHDHGRDEDHGKHKGEHKDRDDRDHRDDRDRDHDHGSH